MFAGYGITAPEHDYDDYAGLDVEGKIVLILRHEPATFRSERGEGSAGRSGSDEGPEGLSYSRHAYFVTKAKNAQSRGAVGLILFTDPRFSQRGGGADDLRLFSEMSLEPEAGRRRRAAGYEGFLAVHVSQGLARRIFEPAGWTLEAVQEAMDEKVSPAQVDLGRLTADLAVSGREEPATLRGRNVLGYLEGADPELRDQWIVVGAHHDHIGSFTGAGDTVFNGADDNASGIAGVLELAEAFGALEKRPKRSMVFVTFGAEEVGLLGSRALVEQKGLPLEKLVFMMNFDMIGRNPDVPVKVYSSGGEGFAAALEEGVARLELAIERSGVPSDAYSDYYPFHQEGIPFAYFFTGLHEDYHQVGDHADRLDYPRMERIVRLAYEVLFALADGPRSEVEPAAP